MMWTANPRDPKADHSQSWSRTSNSQSDYLIINDRKDERRCAVAEFFSSVFVLFL